jgi:hypothetical protein
MDKVSNTFDLLAPAMEVEALRQKTIAGNIANAETPGYVISCEFSKTVSSRPPGADTGWFHSDSARDRISPRSSGPFSPQPLLRLRIGALSGGDKRPCLLYSSQRLPYNPAPSPSVEERSETTVLAFGPFVFAKMSVYLWTRDRKWVHPLGRHPGKPRGSKISSADKLA